MGTIYKLGTQVGRSLTSCNKTKYDFLQEPLFEKYCFDNPDLAKPKKILLLVKLYPLKIFILQTFIAKLQNICNFIGQEEYKTLRIVLLVSILNSLI